METGKSRVKRVRDFITDDVWDVEVQSLSRLRRLGVNCIRVSHLVIRGFIRDECPLHASALTFNTLMSMVPVLALSLSIAKGLGAGDTVRDKIQDFVHTHLAELQAVGPGLSVNTAGENEAPAVEPGPVEMLTDSADFPGMWTAPEPATTALAGDAGDVDEPDANDPGDIVDMVDAVIEQIFSYVDNINFAKLGGLGLVVLIWSVVSVLGRVEFSFNRVWGVVGARSITRKFTDYLGVVLLAPILVILSSSLPAINLAHNLANQWLPGPFGAIAEAIFETGILKHLTVIALVGVSFALFIMIMPNTRVQFVPAFVGGLVAALLFILWLWICVRLQVGLSRQGAIYGSFAILPILLLWVLMSWQIVLFGTEVSFAVQNCGTYRMEQTAGRASAESKIVLALHIVSQSMDAMRDKRAPFNALDYAREHSVSVRLLNEVLRELGDAGLVACVADAPDRYVLLRSPESMRVKDVVTAMLRSGVGPRAFGLHRLHSQLHETLGEVEQSAESLIQPPSCDDDQSESYAQD
jgi:membrane protein